MYQGSEGQSLYCVVQPQLEYASEAWNPHTAAVVNSLEQVRRSAAHFVHGDYRITASSSALVLALSRESLHARRLLAQCTLFHKIHHHLVSIPFPPAITPAAYIGWHDHNPKATIDVYKFSFFPRSVRTWNHLPGPVVEITNPSTFRETALPVIQVMQPPVGCYMLWKQRDVFYSHRAHSHFCRANRGGGETKGSKLRLSSVRPSVTLTKTWITFQPCICL